MRIGIDLDGTITDFNEFIIDKFKDNYKVKNINGYALNEVFDLTQEKLDGLNELIELKLEWKFYQERMLKL